MDMRQRGICKTIFCLFIFVLTVTRAQEFEENVPVTANSRGTLFYPEKPTKISTFSLTQKGYIQFLRYVREVPSIGDFTFCIWMRSNNLTYSHPLLSYSRHESERVIRAWITPGGREIRLAIKENDIIKEPVGLKVNQWYHICQSWDATTGHWDLFLNGKLKSHGYNSRVKGVILPKGGDIVVGQEYTDFDKGLDDGIEGDIFGFNMVLSSTSSNEKPIGFPEKQGFYQGRFPRPPKLKGHYIVHSGPVFLKRDGKNLDQDVNESTVTEVEAATLAQTESSTTEIEEKKDASGLVRNRRQSFEFPLMRFWSDSRQQTHSYFYPNSQYAYRSQPLYLPDSLTPPEATLNKKINRISHIASSYGSKPLGLQLVELSYDCSLGRGAPLANKKVLISWTKTPVRVFGGAILKKVNPFCY